MPYHRTLPSGITVLSTAHEHAAQLEQLQVTVFPSLSDHQRIKACHYRNHVELFPQGQFVALHGNKVVGMTTAIRLPSALVQHAHTFDEVLAERWLSTHDPLGDWLYGIDVGTHPQYRGRGIARALYVARHETVRALGLKGQRTVGMINGYGQLKDTLSAEQYVEKLRRGEVVDPTVSAQMKIGFELGELIPEYLIDPLCANYGISLILPAAKDIDDNERHYR